VLLIYMREEDAFWVLSCICEDLARDIYHRSLVSSIVDEKLFAFLMGHFLPKLNDHLKGLDVPLGLACQPWFLCLFVGYVPMEISLQILDWFFYKGSESLFCVALAIMKIKEKQLLEEKNHGDILQMLKDQISLDVSKELIKTAYSFYDDLPSDKMSELRNLYKHDAIKSLEQSNKKKLISELTEKTQFSTREVEFLYEMFQQGVALSHEPVNYIVLEQFQTIFPKIIPEWESKGLVDTVFEDFDRNRTGKLDLNAFIFGMHRIRKGNLEQQLEYVFSLYNKDLLFDRKTFSNALETYLRLNTREEDEVKRKTEVNTVVRVSFEKLEKGPDDTLTFKEVLSQLLPTDRPTFVDIFGDFLIKRDWIPKPAKQKLSRKSSSLERVAQLLHIIKPSKIY